MNGVESETNARTGVMQVGVLGSATGWYMRDLLRAAESMPSEKKTQVTSLSFPSLSVWSQGNKPARARSITQSSVSDSSLMSSADVSVELNTFHSLLVRTMPLGSLEQIVFRMNALHVAQASGVQIANSPRCLEIAIDKWLTLDIARQAGLLTPKTICCQTRSEALEAFETLGRDVIVKPIFGGEGRGIVRITDPDIAWRVFSTLEQMQSVIYIQEFLESTGYDLRLLVVGEELFCVRRENHGDWRSNISRGGAAIAHEPSFEQIDMAFRASRAVQGWMIGVDILPTRDGRNVLLEVNAVPGWRATAAALQVDMASLILHRLHANVSDPPLAGQASTGLA